MVRKVRLAVIDCPSCGAGVIITRKALMKWNDRIWYPLCQNPMCDNDRTMHFENLAHEELVKLLRMINTPIWDGPGADGR
jgi:hypothetical protein